ncbi:MAG: hypothetical protein J6P07_07000 [Spirochaetaceae bacterium]|nr:hypothetical protein [Spirochaetaceae bacterium]MBO7735833.1 hypothetical protein [Methanobrevibacter sp.]
MTVIQCDKCGKIGGEDFRIFKVKLSVMIYAGVETCPYENMQNVERDLCQDCFKCKAGNKTYKAAA